MGVNSLSKTATRQRRDCELNPGPSAPESSTLTTRLPSLPLGSSCICLLFYKTTLVRVNHKTVSVGCHRRHTARVTVATATCFPRTGRRGRSRGERERSLERRNSLYERRPRHVVVRETIEHRAKDGRTDGRTVAIIADLVKHLATPVDVRVYACSDMMSAS